MTLLKYVDNAVEGNELYCYNAKSDRNSVVGSETPSFPFSFLFPFLTCCAILLTSFGGKGPKGTPFEAMTGRTAPSSYGLLAEVFWGFPQL